MTLNEHSLKELDAFYASTESMLAGYKHASFSYFAIKQGGGFELSQGRLQLQGVPIPVPSGHFQSLNIRAGIYKLDEFNQTPKGIIESLLSGKLPTPSGELSFPEERDRSYSVYFNPFHKDGIQSQRRQMQLSIYGGRRPQVNSIKLDWELKAATTPFEGIQDLCSEYSVGPISGDVIGVEVTALNLAAIATDSLIKGTKAYLAMILADGLNREKASLGFRIFDKDKVTKRGLFSGAELSWTTTDAVQRGAIEINVPSGAVLHCFANYTGEAQHYYWVTDPTTAPNPLHAVYQAFDSELEVLHELINKSYVKGQNAREFEVGIARLLWMLGFSVTHLGGLSKTSNAPDLIAVTAQGQFAVVECTTGLLKADNKLSLLVERTDKVRQRLVNSGNAHLRVLPIIVTSKTRDEVKADLEQAQRLGVFVITREAFPELINRSLTFPDASRLYTEAEDALKPASSLISPLSSPAAG